MPEASEINELERESEKDSPELSELVDEPATPEAALDFMWQAFGNLNEWVRFSDTKAAAVLATNGVIAGALTTLLAGSHMEPFKHRLAIVWVCVILIIAFYSASYALLSLMPQLQVTRKKGVPADPNPSEESSSLIFFMDIDRAFPSNKDFRSTINEALADTDKAVSQISQQVWANSKVASIKYNRVTKALYGLLGVLVVGFIGVITIAISHLF